MIEILGLSGSLRAGSFNTALLRNAAELAPADARIEQASIRGIPLYDGDVEARGGNSRRPCRRSRSASSRTTRCSSSRPSTTTRCPASRRTRSTGCRARRADIARVFGGRVVGVIGASPERARHRARTDRLAARAAHARHAALVRRRRSTCRTPARLSTPPAGSWTRATASACADISRASSST